MKKPTNSNTPDAKPEAAYTNTPTPLVTSALVLINLLVFGLMYKEDPTSLWHPSVNLLLKAGASYGPLFAGGQWWRILTSGFVHIGAIHLLFNMGALYSIGSSVEQRIGMLKYLAIYLISMTAGSLLSLYVHPYVVCAGASGAIFGLLGCQLLIIWSMRQKLPTALLLNLLLSDLLTIAMYIAIGFFIRQIDNSAHIGGLLGGIISGLALLPLSERNKLPNVLNGVACTVLVLALLQTNNYVEQKAGQATEDMTAAQKAEVRSLLKIDACPFWLPRRLASPAEALGSAALQCPDYQTAIGIASKAVEIDKSNAYVYYSRACVQHKFGHDAKALTDIEDAIARIPQQYEFLCLKAKLELCLNKLDEAKNDLSTALKIEKIKHAEANDIAGCLNLSEGNRRSAISCFDKALKENPELGGAFYHRAMVEEQMGNSIKAEQDFVHAQDKNYLPDQWDREHKTKGHSIKSQHSALHDTSNE